MEFLRLFVAVRPPTDTLSAISKVQLRLRKLIDSDSVRWIRRENMHVTLQFLGDTPRNRVLGVIDAMTAGVARASPLPYEIALTVGGFGTFPNTKRPQVVWIGVRDASGELARVRQAVSGQLLEHGFRLDGRPFHPHITLGYVRRRATKGAINAIAAVVTGSDPDTATAHPAGTEDTRPCHTNDHPHTEFTVSELLLVHSTLSPSGAIYSDLHSVPLPSASTRTSSDESARE
ncbi:MAG: RNA 2',3'-cyclic phosphodiesterase [Spirochaetia bacterium]